MIIQILNQNTLPFSFAKLSEDTMSLAYLFQFGVSGIVLCICAFQISMVIIHFKFTFSSVSLRQYLFQITWSELATFAFIIIFFLCMFIEIYIPCFFGALLYYKSSKLTEAAFHSNWIEQSPNFKRLLLMFAQGTHRPIRIFAGGLFELNLPIFLSVIYIIFCQKKNH